MQRVVLPELGEGITTAIVAQVHCAVGDQVESGDDLVELVTDKASFNVSAESSGKVKEILYREGQDVAIGQTLILIEEEK